MRFCLPEMSKDNEESVISLWYVTEGDIILKGQDLLEVVTDKAAFDVPAPCSGKIFEIFKKNGEKVKAGEAIAEINSR
ncbi:MAG: lipoyl domain-containing protein [Candidatus Omnitrophota bacterium]